MTNSIRRFLALNCVLMQGHILDAFDQNVQLAAEGLGIPEQEVIDLDGSLLRLNKAPMEMEPEVASMLNFFRTHEYAFVTPVGAEPIYIQQLAAVDRSGRLDPKLRDAILSQVIMDIQFVDLPIQCCVRDGVFCVRNGADEGTILSYIHKAYELYKDGPAQGKGRILKIRDNLTVSDFKSISAKECVEILRDFVKLGVAPVDYTRTTLVLPSLYRAYVLTGCVMAPSVSIPGGVDILLNKPNSAYVSAISVDLGKVKSIVGGRDLSCLRNLTYETAGRNTRIYLEG